MDLWEKRELKFGCLLPFRIALAGAFIAPVLIWGWGWWHPDPNDWRDDGGEFWNIVAIFFILLAIPMFFIAVAITDAIQKDARRARDRWYEENWDLLSEFERQTYLADRIASQIPVAPPPGWRDPGRWD